MVPDVTLQDFSFNFAAGADNTLAASIIRSEHWSIVRWKARKSKGKEACAPWHLSLIKLGLLGHVAELAGHAKETAKQT